MPCSASSLQYLSVFDAAGQLSHQPDAALWVLAKLYGAAGGHRGWAQCCGAAAEGSRSRMQLTDAAHAYLFAAAARPASRPPSAGRLPPPPTPRPERCTPTPACPLLPRPAGAVVSPMQKARLIALCRPLHPDVPIIVREALLLLGLLPADLGGPSGAALPAAPPALGASQPRLSLEQPPAQP